MAMDIDNRARSQLVARQAQQNAQQQASRNAARVARMMRDALKNGEEADEEGASTSNPEESPVLEVANRPDKERDEKRLTPDQDSTNPNQLDRPVIEEIQTAEKVEIAEDEDVSTRAKLDLIREHGMQAVRERMHRDGDSNEPKVVNFALSTDPSQAESGIQVGYLGYKALLIGPVQRLAAERTPQLGSATTQGFIARDEEAARTISEIRDEMMLPMHDRLVRKTEDGTRIELPSLPVNQTNTSGYPMQRLVEFAKYSTEQIVSEDIGPDAVQFVRHELSRGADASYTKGLASMITFSPERGRNAA